MYKFTIILLLNSLFSSYVFANVIDNTHSLSFSDQQIATIASSTAWKNLLYFPRSLHLNNSRSEADDSRFFLSPDGKNSATAELVATLQAMQASGDLGDEHAQCRFPARFYFIKRSFHLDDQYFPSPNCKAFNQWLEQNAAQSITLLFPSSDVSRPASMFGHLFLRLEQKGENKRPILMNSLNYAANTPQHISSIGYIANGLTGGYPGRYTLQPYYVKLKEYINQENRDIWEYPILLSTEELEQFNRHLWEVLPLFYDYFFLDENCAYRIITLLEAIKPELNVTQRYAIRAIPSEMVFALNKSNLLGEPHYRPAGVQTFYYHVGLLSDQELSVLKQWKDSPPEAIASATPQLSDEQRAHTLEVLNEYGQMIALTNKKSDQTLNKRLIRAMAARSKYSDVQPLPATPAPAVRPDEGHFPTVIQVGFGENEHHTFTDVVWHSANHSMVDPIDGYYAGNELVAAELVLRLNHAKTNNQNRMQLQRLDLFRITTMRPVNSFFKPPSWQVRLGGSRCLATVRHTQQPWRNVFEAGVGYSLGTTAYNANWRSHAGLFLMGKLQDQSCIDLTNTVGEYVQAFPRFEATLQHAHLTSHLRISLEEQGKLLSYEAKLFFNKNVRWNMGIQVEQQHELNRMTDATVSSVGVYAQYFLD